MRDLAELNINDAGRPVGRPPPAAETVAAFERAFGLSLPRAYVALLEHANGGHPELDSVDPAGRPEDAQRAVDHFYFLTDDREAEGGLWRRAEEWRAALGPNRLAFAEDGGGNPFFLDFSADPPGVGACLHDRHFEAVPIARSFDEFIDSLMIDPEMI